MNEGIVILAVLAVVNPARVAQLVGTAGRVVLAAGLVAVGALLAAAAGAGRSILDGLDVSEPNAAIAAGFLVALTGVLDLLRPTAPPVAAPPRPVAALVPVAWPVALRPAAVVLALAAGPVAGVVPVAVGAALAAVAVVAASGVPAEGPATPALVRLAAAVGVAAGLDVLIDGVLAV